MSEIISTIKEVVELPSKGLIYDRPIQPQIKLRSMTTQDEMVRLMPSDDKFKVLSDLIDGCIEGDKPEISVYDMCMGDYYALLHALRTVTYGSNYEMIAYCIYCQQSFETSVNLDEVPSNSWDDSILDRMSVTLPSSGKRIDLYYQTPRMADDIARRVRQIQKQNPNTSADVEEMIQKIVYSIKAVDGRKVNLVELEAMVRKMKMADINTLNQKIDVLNESLGPMKILKLDCPHCHNETLSLFRYSSEFFRPTVY